jgi:hypothetical protein
MKNAKKELIKDLKDNFNSIILCADITYEPDYGSEVHFRLPIGYTGEQLAEFLDKLDFDYNNGYGRQQVFGYVWLQDNCWLERSEYDGSEWWDFKDTPLIPDYLKSKQHSDHWELV